MGGNIKNIKFTGTGYNNLKEFHREMKSMISQNSDLNTDGDIDIEEYDIYSDGDKDVSAINTNVDTDIDYEVQEGKNNRNLKDTLKYQRKIISNTSIGATISNECVSIFTGFMNVSKDVVDALIFIGGLGMTPWTLLDDYLTPDDDIDLTLLMWKGILDYSQIKSGDEFNNSFYENGCEYINEQAASGFKKGEKGYEIGDTVGSLSAIIVFALSGSEIFGGSTVAEGATEGVATEGVATEGTKNVLKYIFNAKNIFKAGISGLASMGNESGAEWQEGNQGLEDAFKVVAHTIVNGVVGTGISLVEGVIDLVFPLNSENPWLSMGERAFSKGAVDAISVPVDALIDSMFNDKSFKENFEISGGFESMKNEFLWGMFGSAVDDTLSFKDYNTAGDNSTGKVDSIDDFEGKTDGYLDSPHGGKVDSIDGFEGKAGGYLDDSKNPKGDVSSINSDEIEKYKNDNKKQEEKRKASNITAQDVSDAIQSYGSSFSSNIKIDLLIYNDIILYLDQTFGAGCGFQMILDYINGAISIDDPYYAFLSVISKDDLRSFVLNFSVYNDIKKGKCNWDNSYFYYLPCYGGKQSIIGDSTSIYTWTDPEGNTKDYTYDLLFAEMINWRKKGYNNLPKPNVRVSPRYETLLNYIKYKHGIIDSIDSFQILNRINATGSINDLGGCCTYDTRFKVLVDYLRVHPEMNDSFKTAFGYDLVEYKNGQTILNEDRFFIDIYVYFLKKDGVLIPTGNDYSGDQIYGIDPMKKIGGIDIYGNSAIDNSYFPYLAHAEVNLKSYDDQRFNEFLSDIGLGFVKFNRDIKYCYRGGSVDVNSFYKTIEEVSKHLKNGGQVELNFHVWDIGNNQKTYPPMAYKRGCDYQNDLLNGGTGGHATYITGVCEKGVYISTWGDQYLIPYETFTNGLFCDFNFVTIS